MVERCSNVVMPNWWYGMNCMVFREGYMTPGGFLYTYRSPCGARWSHSDYAREGVVTCLKCIAFADRWMEEINGR